MRKVKHGELPGDVPRSVLIRMREKPLAEIDMGWWLITVGQVRMFRRHMKRKTIKTERRRGKAEMGSYS